MPLYHPKSLTSVKAYSHKPFNRTVVAAVFAVGYAVAVAYVVQTAGDPYLAALAQQAKLDSNISLWQSPPAEVAAVVVGSQPAAKPAREPQLDEDGFPILEDEEEEPEPEVELKEVKKKKIAGTGVVALSGNGTDDDDLNGTVTKPRPLPHEWLPSAGACLFAFLWATLHALFYLLCRWSVDFKARAFFAPSPSGRVVGDGSYLQLTHTVACI